jgi:hypothetical protein
MSIKLDADLGCRVYVKGMDSCGEGLGGGFISQLRLTKNESCCLELTTLEIGLEGQCMTPTEFIPRAPQIFLLVIYITVKECGWGERCQQCHFTASILANGWAYAKVGDNFWAHHEFPF